MRRNHILKHNASTETWRNLFIFDTETTISKDVDGSDLHTLRLGWSCFVRRDVGSLTYTPFTTADEFWGELERRALPKQKLVVLSHNLFFDLCQVGFFTGKYLNKWALSRPCIGKSGLPFFFTLRYQGRSILFLDSLNLLPGTLASIADSLGMKKGAPDFATVTETELSLYCRHDVEILVAAVLRFLDFLQAEDLGNVQRTIAGQAFTAYRHRFMHRPLYLHAHPGALRLELDAYHGGRCEVFKVGQYRGTFYKLDVNSMYPYIMRNYQVPTRLCGWYEQGVDRGTLGRLLDRYYCFADVTLRTDDPAYGHVYDKRLCFPTGTFREVLGAGALRYALKAGHLSAVHRVACYDAHVIFHDYVDHFWEKRRQAKEQQDAFLVYVYKMFLNSLYGKFGQKAHETLVMKDTKEQWFGSYTALAPSNLRQLMKRKPGTLSITEHLDDRVPWHVWQLRGTEIWSRDLDEQDSNAFCGIAAAITEGARLYLWFLITAAGLENVWYTDTDSLIVNGVGKDNLRPWIGDQLGQLKIEETANRLTIHAPKDYEFNGKTTLKGIKPSAVYDPVSQTYQQPKWTRLKGYLRNAQPEVYRVTQVYKKLQRRLTTKTVDALGTAHPLVLGE